MKDIIISLFDFSGSWSLPYERAGYEVIRVDIKSGVDILKWNYKAIPRNRVAGVLAAPPCTDFAVSGAQYWNAKDNDGTTALSVKLVLQTLKIIKWFNPDFWALENPVGRLNTLIPALAAFGPWYWQPFHYGDPWTKKTGIWGKCNRPAQAYTLPMRWAAQGSWSQLLGGKGERTKEIRSITPGGFAHAFFKANNPTGAQIADRLNIFGRCKYGQWTCLFAVDQAVCDDCEDADSYEPGEYEFDFETEEKLFFDIYDNGEGIKRAVVN